MNLDQKKSATSKQSKRFVISLGGSIIVPDEIDVQHLRKFKALIETEVKKNKKFLIITGGGRTSRRYSEAAKKLKVLNSNDLDWLGIHTTRLNAHLMRTIFRKIAHHRIVTNPSRIEKTDMPVIIAAGYRPGNSTDLIAVRLAKKYQADTVLNLSNIAYVYDKDPKTHKNAKALKSLDWKEFRKIVGNKWDPGLNAPFDPVASHLAQRLGLEVVITSGKDINNIKAYLDGKKFKGTIIK
jgi:uridylate kinase